MLEPTNIFVNSRQQAHSEIRIGCFAAPMSNSVGPEAQAHAIANALHFVLPGATFAALQSAVMAKAVPA